MSRRGKLKTVTRRARWCSPAGTGSSRISPTSSARSRSRRWRPARRRRWIYTNVQLRNWEALDASGRLRASPRCHRLLERRRDRRPGVGRRLQIRRCARPIRSSCICGRSPTTGDPERRARDQAQAGALLPHDDELRGHGARDPRHAGPARWRSFGFDAARDIEAITCNRWSQGYVTRIYAAMGPVLARRQAADRNGAQGAGAASPSPTRTQAPTPMPIRPSTRRRAR